MFNYKFLSAVWNSVTRISTVHRLCPIADFSGAFGIADGRAGNI